ncbi:Rieske 2Fe-2S domain-containing protein [Acidisphaera sp. S103]|uniref:Rieske (2Fe-2S) protein n=1 Tax=Acidisphaera sp. S103 TaxID=1747223 RepID=UPI00131D4B83|nr:Rieske 2Fe-2S domain-containing protein [Acidisphaera sp. S103]
MTQHVVAPVAEVPPGSHKLYTVKGRPIAVFKVDGEYFGMLDRCPHQGGSLCAGVVSGVLVSGKPGTYRLERNGELVRCPWHGWEFDIRTGQSYCDPAKIRGKSYPMSVASGAAVSEGPYVAETVPVRVEQDYIVVEM